MSLKEVNRFTYPTLPTPVILGAVDLFVAWCSVQTFAASAGLVFDLLDTCHIFFLSGLP